MQSRIHFAYMLVAATLVGAALTVFAQAPSWWTTRGVLRTGAGVVTNDFAPVNQGQIKWLATQAAAEFDEKLQGVAGSGSPIAQLLASFSPMNNYRPVNGGQLKYVAQPFYDCLFTLGLTNNYPAGVGCPYPWSGSTNPARDFALANIGQAKFLFSFDLTGVSVDTNADTDANGLPDWWEVRWFGKQVNANADPLGDGISNAERYGLNIPPTQHVNVVTLGQGDLTFEIKAVETSRSKTIGFQDFLSQTNAALTPSYFLQLTRSLRYDLESTNIYDYSFDYSEQVDIPLGMRSGSWNYDEMLSFYWGLDQDENVSNEVWTALAQAAWASNGICSGGVVGVDYCGFPFNTAWTNEPHAHNEGPCNGPLWAFSDLYMLTVNSWVSSLSATTSNNIVNTSWDTNTVGHDEWTLSGAFTTAILNQIVTNDLVKGDPFNNLAWGEEWAYDPYGVRITNMTCDPTSFRHLSTNEVQLEERRLLYHALASTNQCPLQTGTYYKVNLAHVLTSEDYSTNLLLGAQHFVARYDGGSQLVFNAAGTLLDAPATNGEVNVTALKFDLVPDFNHDRVIDDTDKSLLATNGPFRFWINDDSDSGDVATDGSDVPGQTKDALIGGVNFKKGHVCGRCDLLDFSPVWLDLHEMLNLLPPGGSVVYKLKHADSKLNVVYTALTKEHAGDYLTTEGNTYGPNLAQDSFAATKIEVTSDGIVIPANFLALIKTNSAAGIIMLEGAGKTISPLVLEVLRDNQRIVEAQMPLSIDGVEKMYRWVNLRNAAGGAVSRATDTNQPQNYLDSICNGKQFIFVHGYRVHEEAARAWNAEMFKRLYQSGSRAMFTAVTWYGNEGQISAWVPFLGGSTPDYYANVVNAFETSSNLATIVNGLPGQKYIAGHSLGNILVSSAIKDNGLSVNAYFMIDAAVAMEAYKDTEINRDNMRHPDWQNYSINLWTTEWHNLFNTNNDGRGKLTWRGRFNEITPVYNYYSSTEDVLDNGDGQLHLSITHWAWYNQEVRKGTTLMWLATGTEEAGWGFNSAYTNDDGSYPLLPASANLLTPDTIRTNSFFNWFDNHDLYGTNGSAVAQQPATYRQLLADALPALSFAMGRNDLSGFGTGSHDLDSFKKGTYESGNWPEPDNHWHHSDIKDIAYPFIYRAFDQIVIDGDLQ